MASCEPLQANMPAFRTDDDFILLSKIIRSRCGDAQSEILARNLITRFSDIGKILGAEPAELKAVSGIGDEIAEEFAVLRELMLALARKPLENLDVLDNYETVFSYCGMLLANERREQFHALYLNKDYRLILHKCLQIGTVDHVTVYPREVMHHALTCHACSVILVHNHPSGNVLPSEDDISITAALVKIGNYLGITVSDHIIVAGGKSISFRQKGIMPSETRD